MGGSVGLIIGSSNGGAGDVFLNGFAPIGFKSTAWVFDRRGFDGLCLCVWLRKKNTVEGEVEGEGCG